jgi:hypothetical protein
MATMDQPQVTDIPEAIVEAFRKSPLMPFLELVKVLGMDRTTLLAHIHAGHLPWRQKGLGEKSPRRVFTLSDVAVFLDHMQRPSIQQRDRLSVRQAEEIVRIAGLTHRRRR